MPQEISNKKSTFTLSKLSSSGKAQAKIIAGDAGIDGAKQAKFLNRAMRQMSQPHLLSAHDRQVREVHQQKLNDRLLKVVDRSMNAATAAANRADSNSLIVIATDKSLKKTDSRLGLNFESSPRNPRAILTHTPEELTDCIVPAFHDFYRADNVDDQNTYRVARAQTYLAELLLNAFPNGLEVQVAFSIDGKKILLSSNLDATNDAIRMKYGAMHAEELIACLTKPYAEQLSSPNKADQNDRAIRHVLKLASRWRGLISPLATVHLPQKTGKQQGKHAELRIVDDEIYFENGIAQFHLPSGVREPCMACAIALYKKIEIAPAQTTALWPTMPTLMALGLTGKSPQEIAEQLGASIGTLIKERVRFAERSRIRGLADDGSPATTDKHAADSESDIEES